MSEIFVFGTNTEQVHLSFAQEGPPGPAGPEGPQGPVGPQGAPGAGYEHVQASALATWTISHSLGIKPSVSIVSVGGVAVTAEVVHLSNNVLEIRFNSPFAGTAHLV